MLLTFAKTSGETSSSADHSFPFLFPTVWRQEASKSNLERCFYFYTFFFLQKYHPAYITKHTLSFMSRSLTIKLATMDFMGDANWSGASIEMWPSDTSGVMSCSGTSAFRLRESGCTKTETLCDFFLNKTWRFSCTSCTIAVHFQESFRPQKFVPVALLCCWRWHVCSGQLAWLDEEFLALLSDAGWESECWWTYDKMFCYAIDVVQRSFVTPHIFQFEWKIMSSTKATS